MNSDVLNSWKEVAAYLGRGVRTVQRWEQELGLPVRRPRGKERSAIIALKPELDRWLHRAPNHRNGHAAEFRHRHLVFKKNIAALHEQANLLALRSQLLCERADRAMQLSSRLCGGSNGHKPLRISRTEFMTDTLEQKTNGNFHGPVKMNGHFHTTPSETLFRDE